MSDQHYCNAAQALRSRAVGACAVACGRWRMSAIAHAQPQAVIDGKPRAHRA